MKQIALELRYGSQELMKPSGNFWHDFNADIHLAVTKDVYETAFDFTQRYGTGTEFHFSLSSYYEGVALIKELSSKLEITASETTLDGGESFKSSDLLMLFVYVQNVSPRQNGLGKIQSGTL